MEKILLKELKENTSVEAVFLIRSIEEKSTKAGKPYLVLDISDGETTEKAKIWNMALEQFGMKSGELIFCKIETSMYNGSLDHTIREHRFVREDDGVDIKDYITKAPIPAEKMYEKLLETAMSFQNKALSSLIGMIYEDNREKLLKWGAASAIHHNYLGGLLYHTYRMCIMGSAASTVYKTANRELVLAGIMLHDIGKLEELVTDDLGSSVYTIIGELKGHNVIGAEMVREYSKKVGLDEELELQLEHLILSHHGKLEYGSPVEPKTLEALIVSRIDEMDSKVFSFEENTGDPGTITSNRVFGLGVKVYTPNI